MVHIWNDPSEVPADFGPSVVTFGNFDGVHRGHQQVLSQLIRTARLNQARAVAITFDPHPAQVHRPESAPGTDAWGLEDKLVALGEVGLDAVLVMKYSLELASLTPEEFVSSVLVDALKASHVVIGHDARFGRGNSGRPGHHEGTGEVRLRRARHQRVRLGGLPGARPPGRRPRRRRGPPLLVDLGPGSPAGGRRRHRCRRPRPAAPDARRGGPRRRPRPRPRVPDRQPLRRRQRLHPGRRHLRRLAVDQAGTRWPPPFPSAPTPPSTASAGRWRRT